MDERIVEQVEVTEQRLWNALLAELSPQGQQLLHLYQGLFLGRLLLLGDLRPGPNLDRDGLRGDLREMVPIAQAFVEGGEVAEAA